MQNNIYSHYPNNVQIFFIQTKDIGKGKYNLRIKVLLQNQNINFTFYQDMLYCQQVKQPRLFRYKKLHQHQATPLPLSFVPRPMHKLSEKIMTT